MLLMFGGHVGLEAVSVASQVSVSVPTANTYTRYPHLLPGNCTPLERAFSGSAGRLSEVPHPIREVFRWDTCPEPLLPWLAWEMSVDLWNEAWPVERKRLMIREAFELHRRKGTLYAIERYLSYADAPLRRAIVPPDIPFLGADITADERDAWLGRFPQLRIFRYRGRADGSTEAFLGNGSAFDDMLYLGAGPAHDPPEAGESAEDTFFCVETDAWARYGRRAFLWDKGPHRLASGIETPLKWVEQTTRRNSVDHYDFERVVIPARDPSAVFCETMIFGDGPAGEFFLGENVAGARIVSVAVERTTTINEPAFVKRTLAPSLEPIKAVPDTVAERGTAQAGVEMFCGMRGRFLDPATRQRNVVEGFIHGFLVPNDAGERLYERFHLYDPARGPANIDTTFFLNDARLGMPAFNAELAVEVRGRRGIDQFGEYVAGFFDAHDGKPLDLALAAITRSKAHRDRVLVETALHAPISTRDRITTRDGYRSGGIRPLYLN